MPINTKPIFILACTLLLFLSCSKEAAVTTNNSGSNGAGGSLARFTLVGNYLYLVDNSNLIAYDCSDPKNLVEKSNEAIDFRIETIYPYKNKLFIGSTAGMYVYSLENPAKPKLEGSVTHVRACDPVVGNDSAAYVTLRSFGTNCGSTKDVLNVYNIKELQKPALVKTIEMASPFGLGISGKALYVCDGLNGLKVFDISSGYEPKLITTIAGKDYQDVIPYDNVLICHVATGISFFDISDPLKPIEAGIVND
jgi:hypothetical protein